MLSKLNGYKTYAIAVLTLVYAISGYLLGNIDTETAVQLVIAALGLSALRHSIK